MSYTEPDLTEDDETKPEGEQESNDLRNLRRKAKEADQLRKEVDAGNAAKRELAFVKAGIDTDSPLGAMFARAYDGDLTKEAIATAFSALGGPTGEPTEDEIPAAEQASTRERQNLGSGATGDTGEAPEAPVNGEKGRAVTAGQAARRNGATAEDAMATTFAELVGAAAQGDRSVIVPFGGEQ